MTICAQNLSFFALPGRPIVEDISLDLEPGERLAIIGPNGAGKTTLLRMLCGLLDPTFGAVFHCGQRVASMRPAERARHFAVVGQSDHPDGRLRLRDYIELGRIPFAKNRSRSGVLELMDVALQRTGLLSLADREFGTLSGGERQRAQIARALVQEPHVLFLDEPTNHLDPRARCALLALVASLDLTVVAVLHDLHLLQAFATRVAILDQARLVTDGPIATALTSDVVAKVFGIELLRFAHPREDRELTVFDIPLAL